MGLRNSEEGFRGCQASSNRVELTSLLSLSPCHRLGTVLSPPPFAQRHQPQTRMDARVLAFLPYPSPRHRQLLQRQDFPHRAGRGSVAALCLTWGQAARHDRAKGIPRRRLPAAQGQAGRLGCHPVTHARRRRDTTPPRHSGLEGQTPGTWPGVGGAWPVGAGQAGVGAAQAAIGRRACAAWRNGITLPVRCTASR